MARAKVLRSGPIGESKTTPETRAGLATILEKTALGGFDPADDAIRQIVGGFAEEAATRGDSAASASARYGATLGRADRKSATAVSLLEQLGACEDAKSS